MNSRVLLFCENQGVTYVQATMIRSPPNLLWIPSPKCPALLVLPGTSMESPARDWRWAAELDAACQVHHRCCTWD
jgi:hypothetical protein